MALLWLFGADYKEDLPVLPVIVPTSSAHLCEKATGHPDYPGCSNLKGMYIPIGVFSYILIDEKWADSAPRTIVTGMMVHELIHHVQYKDFRTFKCDNHKEQEAYKYQAIFLDQVGEKETSKRVADLASKLEDCGMAYITSETS